MAIYDWKGFLMCYNKNKNQLEGYGKIFEKLGINDVEIIDED
tara:strand:- start:21287 stop:21412 length:126 start_codon:yes stop_codon:yes gene_type:complete